MKAIKDVRVQLGIGAAFFIVALIDSFTNKATGLDDLSIVGKVSTGIVMVVLAWFFIRYVIIGMIGGLFKRPE